jgi:3-hydroxyisobutyrate dehydrogenase-like beta-hydroxyacid dehydrogenase
MANIGYIGLGAMGGRIADRLLSKGHTVIGHNRTTSKAQWLLDKGMTWGDSPRAVAAAADVTFVMVTDTNALNAVAEGPESPVLQYRGPFAMGPPKEAWFDVNMMQKDTTYALEMGKALGVALPTGAIANQFLTAARGLGLEKEDCAVLFHVLAKISGVPA